MASTANSTQHEGETRQPMPPTFSLNALLSEVAQHAELDLPTLTFHLEQSDATAADGYWHASINEARSALEALVSGIMATIGKDQPHKPSSTSHTPFSNWRRFLVEMRFLRQDESDMLHFVYGLNSAKGSHQGVPDEAWCRLARRMVYCAADYMLRRYAEWKRRPPPNDVLPSSNGARAGVFSRVVGRLPCFWRRK